MKKLIILSFVVLGVTFLAGCGKQQSNEIQSITPAETPEQIVSRLIKKENYMTINITDSDDSHIRAEINFNAPDCNTASPKGPCGGHFALFAKENDEWKKAFEGQECVKKDITQYNFPQKMLTSCY